jgi:hypothetical protein
LLVRGLWLLTRKPIAKLLARLFRRPREFQSARAPRVINPSQLARNFDVTGGIENKPKLNSSAFFNWRDDLKSDARFAHVQKPAAIIRLELDVGEPNWLGARSAPTLRRGSSLRPSWV